MEFKMNDKFERVTQPGKDIERKDKVPEKKKPGPQMSWDIKASLFLMFVALLLVVAIFMPTSKVAKSADDSSGPQVKDITSIVEAASRAIDDADASAIAHGEAENAPIVYRDHSPASLGPAENVNSGTDESRSVQDEREADTSERSGEEGFTTVAADAYCMGSWGVHRRQLDDASSAEQCAELVRAEEGCASTFYLSVDKGKCRCVLKGQECQLDKSENAKGITVYRFGGGEVATDASTVPFKKATSEATPEPAQ
ncbi:hypothetical protein CYMTET_25823, partial [Cymbomonas tetramitiformis]